MMRKHLIIVSFIFALLSVGVGFAQKNIVKATINTEFYVNELRFPAGTYYFECHTGAKPYLKIVGNNESSKFKMVQEIAKTEPVKDGKLVFLWSNNKMMLHKVLVPGDDHVHDIAHDSTVTELPVGY